MKHFSFDQRPTTRILGPPLIRFNSIFIIHILKLFDLWVINRVYQLNVHVELTIKVAIHQRRVTPVRLTQRIQMVVIITFIRKFSMTIIMRRIIEHLVRCTSTRIRRKRTRNSVICVLSVFLSKVKDFKEKKIFSSFLFVYSTRICSTDENLLIKEKTQMIIQMFCFVFYLRIDCRRSTFLLRFSIWKRNRGERWGVKLFFSSFDRKTLNWSIEAQQQKQNKIWRSF